MPCAPTHWAHWVVLAVVFGWTIWGFILSRHLSALVLVLAWAGASDYRCATGVPLSNGASLGIDLAQVAVIALCAWPLWAPAARRDLIVLAGFPLFAVVYALRLHPNYAWWLQWAIQLLQLLIAGPSLSMGRNSGILRVQTSGTQMGGGT